jgi:cyclic pyranopterin phosphate synthase
VSITDKCNLKCVYCTPQKELHFFKRSEVLSYEEIVRFIRIAARYGLRKVRITGGEPLMRRNVVSLIASIKEVGIRDISITTNGTMLKKYALSLKRAGLDRVNISLDTLSPERYEEITKGGNIHHVWEALEEAERVGLSPVKINVVPIRGLNDNEIESFASLTFQKNYHIRFIEFMPIGANSLWKKNKSISSSEIKKRVAALGDLERLRFRGGGPSRNYRIEGAKGVIGIISPLTDHFCKYCNRLRLSANGIIRPCLFSDREIDIKTPMRNGISDKGIEQLFYDAIKTKPRGHVLHKNRSSSRSLEAMSKIGG